MAELLLTLGIVVLLAGGAALVVCVPWHALLVAGMVLTVAGLALGLPTGLWYHVALRRALVAAGALPRWWWVRPAALHPRLSAAARPRVMRWFVLGAVGFGLAILGCLLAGVGALRAR